MIDDPRLSAIVDSARRMVVAHVSPVNDGIRCRWCQSVHSQLVGHFEDRNGEIVCPIGDLEEQIAVYDAYQTALAEAAVAEAADAVLDAEPVPRAYCPSCRAKQVRIVDPVLTPISKNRWTHRGKCPDCETTISTFAKAPDPLPV